MMDTGGDFNLHIGENKGWKHRSDLIDGSMVIQFISELGLDIGSSYKG
ncbi:MAG: hypothetical protein GY740_08465 [Gammaproteobacteria bacterium]|nr:hypothetical protein [Gammaproteobacteria bacterium]